MKRSLDSMILTRQELKIMKVVWERGAATVREVCNAMSQKKSTAYTTVLTLIGILEEKGALVHTKSGRSYIYHPLLTRQQATRNQVRDVLMRFFDGSPEKLIENLLKNEIKEPEHLETVKSLLGLKQEDRVA